MIAERFPGDFRFLGIGRCCSIKCTLHVAGIQTASQTVRLYECFHTYRTFMYRLRMGNSCHNFKSILIPERLSQISVCKTRKT